MTTSYEVDLVFGTTKADTQLARLEQRLKGINQSAATRGDQFAALGASASGAQGKIGMLVGALGAMGAALGVATAAMAVFRETANLETQVKSIEVLTGSLEKTRDIVKELKAFGAVTPFTSSELIDTAKRLSAFGVESEKLVATTKRLGDISGATGARLGEVALAYGQVMAKGRVQTEELLQFQERGIGIQTELQKMYNLSGAEMQKAISAGQVPAEALEAAIIRLTDKGGKYANGAIAQSETLNGKLSTLTDNIQTLAQTIGAQLEPAFKSALEMAISMTAQVQALVSTMGNLAAQTRELRWQEEAQTFVDSQGLGIFDVGKKADLYQRRIAQSRADWELSQQQTPAAATAGAMPLPGVPALTSGTQGGAGGKGKKDKGVDRIVVIGGITGGDQADASRGRSSGAHLHGQRVSGAGINSMIAAALEFPGGRSALDYGERRRPGYHDGYAGNDYGTPSGTPFKLRPGWVGTDMGIRGPLGRGLRVSGPGGVFELGHLRGVTSGKGSSSSDPLGASMDWQASQQKAWEEQERARIATAERLQTNTQLVEVLGRQLAIQREQDPLAKAGLQVDLDIYEVRQKYGKLIAEETDPASKKLLQKAEGLELDKISTDYQQKEVDLLREQLDLLYKRSGIPARGPDGALPFTTFGAVAGETDAARAGRELKELMDPAAQLATSAETVGAAFGEAFKAITSGTATVQDALAGLFQSIADSFINMLSQMMAKWLEAKILGMLGGGGGLPSFAGGVFGAFNMGGGFGIGTESFAGPFLSAAPSFAGGGYTGSGSRSGGIDGKGGFAAILHPNETVLDHSTGGTSTGAVNSIVNVNVAGGGAAVSPENMKRFGALMESVARATIQQEQRPGGTLSGTR